MTITKKLPYLFLSALLSLLLFSFAYANSEKLNSEITAGAGEVQNFQISPDNQYVVYIAEHDTQGVEELYSVPINGGTPIKLNGPLVAGGNVESFIITPDSATVIYDADQDRANEEMLYRVPINGGGNTKLSLDSNDYDPVSSYELITDQYLVHTYYLAGFFGLRLTNLADNTTVTLSDTSSGENTTNFLFDEAADKLVYFVTGLTFTSQIVSINLDGSDRLELITPLTGSEYIRSQEAAISADSNIIYRKRDATNSYFELYSVPVLGGPAIKLSGSAPADESVHAFKIDNQTNHVIFIADQANGDKTDIFRIPTAGGTTTSLNIPLGVDENILPSIFLLSPDQNTLVYTKRDLTTEETSYHAIPSSGGSSIKISPSLDAGQSFFTATTFTPNGQSLLLIKSDPDLFTRTSWIYTTSLQTGEATLVAGPLLSETQSNVNVKFDAATDTMYYLIDDQVYGRYDLYSVPATGGVISQVSDTIIDRGKTQHDFVTSPDGTTLVFRSRMLNFTDVGLYSLSLNRNSSVRLDQSNVIGGDVTTFQLSADEQYAIYISDQDENDVFEIYSAKTDQSGVVKLNNDLVFGGLIQDFLISADSSTVVFKGDGDRDDRFELYSSPIDGGGATRLLPDIGTSRDVRQYAISADSQHLIFIAEGSGGLGTDLYRMPIAGGPITKLNANLPNQGTIFNFKISPDSSTVAFLGELTTLAQVEAAVVPISGGTQTIMSTGLTMTSNSSYHFDPASQNLIFTTSEGYGYTTPLSGGTPVNLTPAGIIMANIQFSNDLIIYRGRTETDFNWQLYSIPVGGGTPFKINSTSALVLDFKVHYDTALYNADGLYSASITTGGEIQLANNIVQFAPFDFAANDLAVFIGDSLAAARLYTVPISGGTPSNISGAFQPNSQLFSYRLSGNGSFAFFIGDKISDEKIEIFRAPVLGGEVLTLNNPTTHLTSIYDYQPCFDGDCVFYGGDFETFQTDELWMWPDSSTPSAVTLGAIAVEQPPQFFVIIAMIFFVVTCIFWRRPQRITFES